MMKKAFFYTFAVVAALTSCSSENGEQMAVAFLPSEDVISLNVMTPTMGNGSRGTGTVGSIDPTENQWKGQSVRVYMLNKGTLTPTLIEDADGELKPIFQNAEMFTPKDVAEGPISRPNNLRSYYPINGSSDFWAYRTDGAETATPVAEGTKMTVPFAIDGSQDIMVGQTDNSIVSSVDQSALYSAKSARMGVVPKLFFKHLLTRLTFDVKALEDKTDYSEEAGKITESQIRITNNQSLVNKDLDFCLRNYGERKVILGVFIDSIMIESAATGKVVFAYTPSDAEKAQYIIWNESPKRNLTLRERPAISGVPQPSEPMKKMDMVISPAHEYRQIGEALLVKPAAQYNLRVAMHQYKQEGLNVGKYIRKAVIWPNEAMTPHVIDLSSLPGKGAAGYSYKVRLGVSGLEEIKLEGVLDSWEDGGTASKDVE